VALGHQSWSFRGGSSPELAELGPPGRDSSGKRVREVRHNTRNPPRVTAGLAEALGGRHKGESGSAWHDSPVCAFTRCSGLENGGKRLWVRACAVQEQPEIGSERGYVMPQECHHAEAAATECRWPCSGCRGGLRPIRTSAKGLGGKRGAHRG
jgi:hypothetical protein